MLLDRVRRLSRAGEVVERGLTCRHPGEPAIGVSSRSAEAHDFSTYGGGHCEDWTSETATGRECGESATATATGDSEGSRHPKSMVSTSWQSVRPNSLSVCCITESFGTASFQFVNWNSSFWKGFTLLASRCLLKPPRCPAPASRPQQPASDTSPRPYDQTVP